MKHHFYDFFLPALGLGFLTILFHQTHLDEWIAGHFFNSGIWIYRNNFFLEKILHKGGVIFTGTILISFLLSLIWIWTDLEKRKLRNFLSFVLISSVLTISAVSLLKNITTLPCPWNSLEFAGGNTIPSIWMMFSSAVPRAHCFPGGHSSAGFAFLSLYYGYLFVYGKRSLLVLLPGLLIGLLYGFTQQLRGAHFMSHDFATAFISVSCSWVTYVLYSRRPSRIFSSR